MALDHLGIFHSKVTGPRVADLGKLMITLRPVDFTYPMSTRPARAVGHRRASGPPPVSSARWSFPSYQRGDITQV